MKRIAFLLIVTATLAGLSLQRGALAAEIDCGVLLESLSKTGELPIIKINPADASVTVGTSRGTCSEPIEVWSKRKTPAPKKKTDKPAKSAKPAPATPSSGAPSAVKAPQTAPVLPVQIPAQSPKPKATPVPCDYQLEELWKSQVINIEGVSHWLSRIFTIDINTDRIVDNVTFGFKAKDDKERLINYFAQAGEIAGQSYPELRLPDDALLNRLCFGKTSFEKPKFFGQKTEPMWINVPKPDLAGELEAKEKGIIYKAPPGRKKRIPTEIPTPWWQWALLAFGLIVVAGGGAAFVISHRKKTLSKEKSEDDDEEDDDDDWAKDEDKDSKKPKK